MTNIEKIKNMDVDELAVFIANERTIGVTHMFTESELNNLKLNIFYMLKGWLTSETEEEIKKRELN